MHYVHLTISSNKGDRYLYNLQFTHKETEAESGDIVSQMIIILEKKFFIYSLVKWGWEVGRFWINSEWERGAIRKGIGYQLYQFTWIYDVIEALNYRSS